MSRESLVNKTWLSRTSSVAHIQLYNCVKLQYIVTSLIASVAADFRTSVLQLRFIGR